MIAVVRKAALRDPKYATWFLSHKFPERWSDQRGEIKDISRQIKELEKQLEDRRK
jgi:hypothetical protein